LEPADRLWSDLFKGVANPVPVIGDDRDSIGVEARSSLEAYAEGIQSDEASQPDAQGSEGLSDDGWPDSCRALLEGVADERALALPIPFPVLDEYRQLAHWCWRGDDNRCALLWSAIAAADRIRQIATLAFHRGVRIRWFEFTTTEPSGGTPGVLEPINAKELRLKRRSGRLLDALALTVSNRESLVFWSPPGAAHPGVLFTADSDLMSVTLPTNMQGAIVTAPHHGSEANAHAYGQVTAAVGTGPSACWVRSDGRFRARPGQTFLALPQGQRSCTLCRSPKPMGKDAVHFSVTNQAWSPNPPRVCSCV
jgi:hypothetical protein